MFETFFPKRCSRLCLLPVRALGGSHRFWGGCFTIMMCNVFGGSFWGGGGGGSGGMLSNSCLNLLEGTLAVFETFFPSGVRDSVFYR